jgi:hypothetical protein
MGSSHGVRPGSHWRAFLTRDPTLAKPAGEVHPGDLGAQAQFWALDFQGLYLILLALSFVLASRRYGSGRATFHAEATVLPGKEKAILVGGSVLPECGRKGQIRDNCSKPHCNPCLGNEATA